VVSVFPTGITSKYGSGFPAFRVEQTIHDEVECVSRLEVVRAA
jgi:hypothetical protein